jgi:uncharacterized protein YjiS (DUF1127 family)
MSRQPKESDMRIFNPTDVIIDVHGWFRAATERRELLAMDDRMLRDMGITRVDAVRIANEPRPHIVAVRRTPPEHPVPIDRAVIEAHMARAQRLRSEAFANAFATLLRRLRPQPKARIRKLAPVAR